MTLIEVSLAVCIALLIAAISIPAAGSWIEEHKLRAGMGALGEQVMRARIEAERTGEAQTVFLAMGGDDGEGAARWVFPPPAGCRLSLLGADGKWEDAGGVALRIPAGGVVPAKEFRIERGEKWITFRFDPLTGHLEEQEFSL